MLAEHYPTLKLLHVALVITSGALLALRGLGVLAASQAPLATPMRRLSQVIDTGLLATALLLVAAIGLDPFATPWLMSKLALLVGYIVAGYLALRARSPLARSLALAFAVGCFASMVMVARTKDPLAFVGWLAQ